MKGLCDKTATIAATPALIIDVAIVKRNLSRLASYAAGHGIAIRPHTKTHKSLWIAERQLAFGATGLTAAKVGEAEVMVRASGDLLIAYPAIDLHRCSRIAQLARSATMRVAVDSFQGMDALQASAKDAGSTIGVLVDLDVGFHRTGVQSADAVVELAQHAGRQNGLRLDGLFFYPGHVWSPQIEQAAELSRIDALLSEVIERCKRSGLATPIVSGGSTPTAYSSHIVTHQTEIRPGTYVYNDMNTVRGGFCGLDDCAARVLCTLVSSAQPNKVVIDAGTKTLTSDRNVTAPDSGFGKVVEYPDATIVRLSEEHGEVDLSGCSSRPAIGERVTVIPNHICPCVNLQNSVWLLHEDDSISSASVDTRGRLS